MYCQYTCIVHTHTHTPEARKPHIIIHNTTGRYNSAKQLFHAKVTGVWVRKHCPMVSEGTQTYLFEASLWHMISYCLSVWQQRSAYYIHVLSIYMYCTHTHTHTHTHLKQENPTVMPIYLLWYAFFSIEFPPIPVK